MTPVGELPPAYGKALTAYTRGGDEWERARKDVSADPALARFLVDNLVLELVRAYPALAGPSPERARRAFDRAENELVRMGEHAAPVLAGLLAVSDGVLATLATDVLVQIGRPALPSLLPMLDDSRTEARRRAAGGLARLPHGGSDEVRLRLALAQHARTDPEWVVRAECALALGTRGVRDTHSEPWRLVLESCLSDSDPAVAEAATRGLAVLGDPRAIPALITALERTSRAGEVRALRAVQSTLAILSGERAKHDVRGWSDWWLDHRVELEGGHRVESSGQRDRPARAPGPAAVDSAFRE